MYPSKEDLIELDLWAGRQIHHDEFVRRKPEHWAFRARVGKKCLFPTSHDQVQYERGFMEYPNEPPGRADSPRMRGYRDADAAYFESLTGRVERRVDSAFGGLT